MKYMELFLDILLYKRNEYGEGHVMSRLEMIPNMIERKIEINN